MRWRVHGYVRAVGSAALVVLCGCEAHGLVGSNVSAAAGDEGGAETSEPMGSDGVTSDAADATGGPTPGTTSSTGSEPEPVDTDAVMFDVFFDDVPEVCLAPQTMSCDHLSEDPWHALGLNCPGTVPLDISFSGDPSALAVHQGMLGAYGTFSPREGERMVILSSGRAADLPRTHAELGCVPEICPSTAFDPWNGMETLPPPLDVRRVSDDVTCAENPELVGMGDCSNSLEEEFMAGGVAHDYAEVRLEARVPPNTDGFAYQFAFFSAEYPTWSGHGPSWNDMYIAWLESEEWTGNISFDLYGHPISIDGVFLDYLKDAPELEGFAMEGHAGTRWLKTVAPVRPGEVIEVVFAIFDLSDAIIDTVVLLDNVHWSCTDLPPITQPQG